MAEKKENNATYIGKQQKRIWSTKLINQMLEDYANGFEIDYSPFFEHDIDLKAENISFDYTDEEVEEYEKCYNNPIYFIEHYCKWMTDYGYKTVNLRKFQRELIDIVTSQRYSPELNLLIPKNRNIIWMAARQSGKTTTMASIFAYLLTFSKEKNFMLLANKEQTVIEIADKVIQVFKGLPYFLKPGCKSFGKTGFRLDNGCRIITGATTKTTSIGFTVHLLYLDEFAHIDPNIVDSFWRSVYPTLSSSQLSQCMITSTPHGVDNKFYEIWSKSLNGENSFVNFRTDYWQVPEHDEAWVEKQRKDFGETEFAQEFELQFHAASKMILKPSDFAFMDKICVPFVNKNLMTNNPYLQDENITWHPDFDPLNIAPTDKFLFLVDLAEGNGDEFKEEKTKSKTKTPDSNTIQIFKVVPNSICNIKKYKESGVSLKDAVRFVQVGTFETNKKDEEYCGKMTAALSLDLFHSDLYDNCKIMVEMNFQGKNYVTSMKSHPLYYDDLFQKTYHTKPVPGEVRRRRIGFKSGPEKERFCLQGAKKIGQRRIIVRDRKTLIQLESFGYIKGKIKGIACHDDLSYPAVNHIPVCLDDETFISWIGDFIYNLPDENLKYKINQFIKQWELDNPELSDDSFNALYGLNSNPMANFNGGLNELFNMGNSMNMGNFGANPYGTNPYNGNYNPYSTNPYSGQNPYASQYKGNNPYSEQNPFGNGR